MKTKQQLLEDKLRPIVRNLLKEDTGIYEKYPLCEVLCEEIIYGEMDYVIKQIVNNSSTMPDDRLMALFNKLEPHLAKYFKLKW